MYFRCSASTWRSFAVGFINLAIDPRLSQSPSGRHARRMVGTISTLMILVISLSSVRLGQSAISWKPALEVVERSHSDLQSPFHTLLENAAPLKVPIHPVVCLSPVCFPAPFKFRNLPARAATDPVFLAHDEVPDAPAPPDRSFLLNPFSRSNRCLHPLHPRFNGSPCSVPHCVSTTYPSLSAAFRPS